MIYTEETTPLNKSKRLWMVWTLERRVPLNHLRHSIKNQWTKWAQLVNKNVSLSSISFMKVMWQQFQKNTWKIVKLWSGIINIEASNTALYHLQQLICYSQLSEDSHSPRDLLSQCCQCSTSWNGDILGVMKISGDVLRKLLWPMKSMLVPGTSSQWNDKQYISQMIYTFSSFNYLNLFFI